MRAVRRLPLPSRAQGYLNAKQAEVDEAQLAGIYDVARIWRLARKSKTMGAQRSGVLGTLRAMCGRRVRCMYCVDSHACDIEHFRPKMAFPEHAFRWPNLLLCCTQCGRLKGDRFAHLNGMPLLVDPTLDDPWEHLDFDPDTGNIVARFDPSTGRTSLRGEETVRTLQLDRREAVAEGFRDTFRRLSIRISEVVRRYDESEPSEWMDGLEREDDHGLLGWCFGPIGSRLDPFKSLKTQRPDFWRRCVEKFEAADGIH